MSVIDKSDDKRFPQCVPLLDDIMKLRVHHFENDTNHQDIFDKMWYHQEVLWESFVVRKDNNWILLYNNVMYRGFH